MFVYIFRYAIGRVKNQGIIFLLASTQVAADEANVEINGGNRKRRAVLPQTSQRSIGVEYDVDWEDSNTNTVDGLLWITRSVDIRSHEDTKNVSVISGDLMISGSQESAITVTFRGIAFTGNIYVADAQLQFYDCVILESSIQQAYQRREVYKYISYKLYDTSVVNSTITTIPKERQQHTDPASHAQLISTYTSFHRTLINMTAVSVDAVLRHVEVSADSSDEIPDDVPGKFGVYVYSGVCYEHIENTTPLVVVPTMPSQAFQGSTKSTSQQQFTNVRILDSTFFNLYQVT